MAQGQAQCCVTGLAFEHMLHLGDLALLETVMRNVVVFSRMKPHQKGQVMDLLGTRGLHKLVEGRQQHFPVRTTQGDAARQHACSCDQATPSCPGAHHKQSADLY